MQLSDHVYDSLICIGTGACGSIRVAELLALPTSDHGVTGLNPAGGKILPEPKRRFILPSSRND